MVCMVYDFMCCIQSILWINDITCITFTRSLFRRIPNSIIVIRFHIFNEFICIPSAFYSNDQHRTNNKLHANGTKNRLIWWQIKRFIQTNQFLLLAHNQLGIYSLCVDWAWPRATSGNGEMTRKQWQNPRCKEREKGRKRENVACICFAANRDVCQQDLLVNLKTCISFARCSVIIVSFQSFA